MMNKTCVRVCVCVYIHVTLEFSVPEQADEDEGCCVLGRKTQGASAEEKNFLAPDKRFQNTIS